MVVKVVVKERTEGAGDENVLSGPCPVLCTPAVADVPAPDEAPCDCAASEWARSGSVDTVGAIDLFPTVVGGRPSIDELKDRWLSLRDELLAVGPVGTVEKDRWPLAPSDMVPFGRAEVKYGLLFLDGPFFFD